MSALAATASDKLTVHLINILNLQKGSRNGHVIASTYDMTMVKGQGKLATGFNSPIGGANYNCSGLGYRYTFQNAYVRTDKDGEPVFSDDVSTLQTVRKVNYNNDGTVMITFKDGSTETFEANEIYISPVYKAVPNWYLNYYYVDNISTGSDRKSVV